MDTCGDQRVVASAITVRSPPRFQRDRPVPSIDPKAQSPDLFGPLTLDGSIGTMAQTELRSAVAQSMKMYDEEVGDPTTAIYRRFFAANPDAEELFGAGGDEPTERRMMAGIFGLLLDIADGTLDPEYSAAWVNDHTSWEVTRTMVESMFTCIVDEFRDGLGESWDSQMEADWSEVLDRWATVVRAQLDKNGV
jgi:hemoglobin-like flavoprotein